MTQEKALKVMLSGSNVFLTGAAGSGKTHVLKEFVKKAREKDKKVAVTASTGIAATHLNGMTIHSWSGIGIKNSPEEMNLKSMATRLTLASRIGSADILILDEISMLAAQQLAMVDSVCRAIRESPLPFGGLQVILCGDFFQLPPISRDDQPQAEFAFKSDTWRNLMPDVCYLTYQYRQQDADYLEVLEAIRSGGVTQRTLNVLSTRLNQPITGHIKPPRLFAHNAQADAVNNYELAQLSGKSREYHMSESGHAELIEQLKRGCLAPPVLELKAGAKVLFVKNNPGCGYMNGTVGQVIGFEDDYPVVVTKTGLKITVQPEPWEIRDLRDERKTLAAISQIPLRLAWAITIHKSQGMSLDMAEINLSGAFAYGMGYVALSRVRSLSGLNLTGINEIALQVDPEIIELDKLWQKMSQTLETTLPSAPSGLIGSLKKLLPKDH